MKFKKIFLSAALIGSILVSGSAMAFNDMENHWAKQYVYKMQTSQILKGYPDGLFYPERPISREEAAQMISNFLGGSGTKEVPYDAANRWSTDAVRNLVSQDIISGYEDGLFKPEKPITRAEFSKMLHSAVSLKTTLASSPKGFSDVSSHWAKEHIEALAGSGIVKGYGNGTFNAEGEATRAEASAMIYRSIRIVEDPSYKEPTPDRFFKFSKSSGMIYHYNDSPYDPSPKDVVIPEEIDGVKVREIGMWAFRASFDPANPTDKFRKNKITSVVIPEGVEKIDTEAFLYNELTELVLPDSVKEVGSGAFGGNKLISVKMPSTITKINDRVFSSNKLKTLDIPDNVTSIGYGALAGNQLESIDIPKDVNYIEDRAFSNNQLTSVSLPEEITSIGEWTFSNNKLTSVDIPDNVISIGQSAFRYNQLSSLVLPPGIVYLGLWAFGGNNLSRVEMPEETEMETYYDSVNNKYLYPFDDGVEIIRY